MVNYNLVKPWEADCDRFAFFSQAFSFSLYDKVFWRELLMVQFIRPIG